MDDPPGSRVVNQVMSRAVRTYRQPEPGRLHSLCTHQCTVARSRHPPGRPQIELREPSLAPACPAPHRPPLKGPAAQMVRGWSGRAPRALALAPLLLALLHASALLPRCADARRHQIASMGKDCCHFLEFYYGTFSRRISEKFRGLIERVCRPAVHRRGSRPPRHARIQGAVLGGKDCPLLSRFRMQKRMDKETLIEKVPPCSARRR
eukprot:SAG31_NODE_1074_length_10052_cov_88.255400_4_plen_207_part_00